MRYLFDTHTFMWWDGEPEKLSQTVLSICNDPTNQLVLSVVSAWEMQIKSQLGKLTLRLPLQEIIASQKSTNQIEILPCNLSHVFQLGSLPSHHKDPFDRLLIAQAIAEDAILLSTDHVFAKYDVDVIW